MGRGFWDTAKELMGRPQGFSIPFPLFGVAKATDKPPSNLVTPGGHKIEPKDERHSLILPRGCSVHEPYNDSLEAEIITLFEYEGWRIEAYAETPNTPQDQFQETDWIAHYCPVQKWLYRIDQWQIMADEICDECCAQIPEAVMGVWKLKNFDHLPSVEESRMINHSGIYKSSNEHEREIW